MSSFFQAFVTLSYLNLMRMPMSMLPMLVIYLVQVRVVVNAISHVYCISDVSLAVQSVPGPNRQVHEQRGALPGSGDSQSKPRRPTGHQGRHLQVGQGGRRTGSQGRKLVIPYPVSVVTVTQGMNQSAFLSRSDPVPVPFFPFDPILDPFHKK